MKEHIAPLPQVIDVDVLTEPHLSNPDAPGEAEKAPGQAVFVLVGQQISLKPGTDVSATHTAQWRDARTAEWLDERTFFGVIDWKGDFYWFPAWALTFKVPLGDED